MTHPKRWLEGYYLATPAFAVADFALRAPVRVAGLEDPAHRALYYVVAFALGLLCRTRPQATPWVGMGESATNLLLLMLGILLPIWSVPDAFAAGAPLVGPFDRVSLVNVLLSGTAFTVSFYRHQHAALLPRRDRGRDRA